MSGDPRDTTFTESDRFVSRYLADFFSTLSNDQLEAIAERASIQSEND